MHQYDKTAEYLAKNPESVYLDFEDILTQVEGMPGHEAIMRATKLGTLASDYHCAGDSLHCSCH